MLEMLKLPPWSLHPLKIVFPRDPFLGPLEGLRKHHRSIPSHVTTHIRPLEEFFSTPGLGLGLLSRRSGPSASDDPAAGEDGEAEEEEDEDEIEINDVDEEDEEDFDGDNTEHEKRIISSRSTKKGTCAVCGDFPITLSSSSSSSSSSSLNVSSASPEKERWVNCIRGSCKMKAHMRCMADLFLHGKPFDLIPSQGTCPLCSTPLSWPQLVSNLR